MLALFAQRAGAGEAPGGAGGDVMGGAFGAIFIAVYCGILLVSLTVLILFLLSMSKALSRCAPENRTMEPGQVWLALIPIFGLIWQFIMVNRITDSLEREFRERGEHVRGDNYGKSVGMAWLILALCSIIPFVGLLAGPASLVCWILYWVKIAGYSKRLAEGGASADEDYDDEDDRPRRRSRRDEDDELDEDEEDRPRRRR